MAALTHVFLHVGLCNAVARVAPDTTVAMHVSMSYRVGGSELDKVFSFTRGDGTQTVVEFDVPRSIYLLRLDVPKYGCSTSDFLDIEADRNRTVTETLVDGPPEPPKPVFLMGGGAPMSFMYLKPTFVLFDKSVACTQPVVAPLPAHIDTEYDQGSYYAWLHSDPSLDAGGPMVIALRLKTPTGTAHYVRIPIPYPVPWGGWPSSIKFDITEDMIDGLATDKIDTLLCPKMWETSVH